MSQLAASSLPENAADLRGLYRAAETRAARLRVLVEAGQILAAANHETLDAAVSDGARAAAHLAGHEQGRVSEDKAGETADDGRLIFPLTAPGSDVPLPGALILEGRRSTPSAEDREAIGLVCQLIGASLSARAREARLARLLGELLRSQENERSRIAHELHDGVAQNAAALMRRLELAGDGDLDDLARARDQARDLVGELRRVIAGMRPPALDDLGLVPALLQLAAEAEADGIAVALEIAPDTGRRPPPGIETALFRVAQEALNNTRAHAGPEVRVTLRLALDAGRWRLSVADNGRGFDPAAVRAAHSAGGLGLAYMRERVELLDGHLTITSAPGAGCTLLAEVPVA
jgi:signal transduction histidine kinase